MFEDVDEFKPDGEQPFHFYYSREHRIANAPQNVKDYYAGKMETPRGFKVLFNKQNRFILFGLLLVVGFGWGYSGLYKTKAYSNIAGINVELTAFIYEDEVYTSVKMKRSPKSKDMSPKLVEADIMVIEPNKQVSDKQHLTFLYEDGEQFMRTKFTNFDIIRADAVITIGDETVEVTTEVH